MQKFFINVGFDFGTSSTKVCFYNIIDETHHYFVFYKHLNNSERYCKTSVIRFVNDKIYFDDLPIGRKIKLFKINIHNGISSADGVHLLNDFFSYQLVALYCSVILKDVINDLTKRYSNPKITLNFGIPVDHLSSTTYPDKEKEKMFRKAFGMAWLICERNIDIEERTSSYLLQILNELEKEVPDKNQDDLMYHIYPETIAGTGALLLNYTLERMFRYSIVDIGAGTTDISFFHMGEISDTRGKIYIYHSKTLDIGSEHNSNNIEEAKNIIRKTYKLGFGNAYALYPRYWSNDFKLMFLGGGSRGSLKDFNKELELTIPGEGFGRDIVNVNRIDFPIPQNSYDSQNENVNIWQNNFDILAVSYGLSYPSEMLPNYNPQVPPMPHDPLVPLPVESLTPDVG